MIHLYRDSLLYVFIALGIIAYFKKKYFQIMIFTFFSASMRGGHALLLILYLSLLKTYDSAANTIMKSSIVVLSFILIFFSIEQLNFNIVPYLSRSSNLEKRLKKYNDYDLKSYVDNRQAIFSGRIGHQSAIRQLTYQKSLIRIVPNVLLQVFYPITFHFYYLDKIVYPGFYTETKGFSFIEVLKLFSIFAWIWVVPLLILGFINCYQKKSQGYALIMFYVISLLSVVMISMQGRHGLIFVILHPIICQLGYNLLWKERRYFFRYKQYQKMVIFFLLIWNLYRVFI